MTGEPPLNCTAGMVWLACKVNETRTPDNFASRVVVIKVGVRRQLGPYHVIYLAFSSELKISAIENPKSDNSTDSPQQQFPEVMSQFPMVTY